MAATAAVVPVAALPKCSAATAPTATSAAVLPPCVMPAAVEARPSSLSAPDASRDYCRPWKKRQQTGSGGGNGSGVPELGGGGVLAVVLAVPVEAAAVAALPELAPAPQLD